MSYFPALPIFTWGNKPAANSVNVGTTIRISDVGLPSGIVVSSDGVNWLPAGVQILTRSAVAVSLTGSTSETTLASVNVPGGLLGLNGGLRVTMLFSTTNNANNKIPRVKLGATRFGQYAPASVPAMQWLTIVRNRGSASSQISQGDNVTGIGSTNTPVTGAIDTTVDQPLVITGQLAVGTDTMALESYMVELLP